MSIEAMKQALEALTINSDRVTEIGKQRDAIASLRQAIKEHALREVQRLGQEIEQEPVAWMRGDGTLRFADGKMFAVGQPFFTHPPQRTWVGLTEDDKVLINHDANFNQFMTAGEYADRVQQLTEARLRDKNT